MAPLVPSRNRAETRRRSGRGRTWWRGLFLVALLSAPGCYKQVATSPQRAVNLWRSGKLWSPAAQSGAKGAAGVPGSITLKQALGLALLQNQDLHALRATVAEGRARIDEASQLDNPSLRMRDLRMYKLAEGEVDLELGLRVPIPRPDLRSAKKHLEELRLEETRFRIKDREDQLCTRIRQLFARLTMLGLDLKQVEETIRIREQRMKIVETRSKAGAATRLDLATSVLQHAESLDEREVYRVRRADIVRRLIRLIGLSPRQEVEFIPDEKSFTLRDQELNEEKLMERALARRWDLREAASRVNQAQNRIYQARAQRWPVIRFAEVSMDTKDQVDHKAFAISLGLDLPFLSWSSGTIALREATLRRRDLEERALVTRAIQEISRAVGQVQTTATRVKKMEQTLLPAVKQSTEVAADAIKHNVVDPMMASFVELRRVRSQRQYLKALLAHQEALIELQAATGDVQPTPRK